MMSLLLLCLQVDAPCMIERAKDPLLQDHVFSCDVSHAVVPAKGKLALCIRFQPQAVGEHSTDYFTVTPTGCLQQTVLKMVGSCKGESFPCFLLPLSPAGEVLMLGEEQGTVPALIDVPSIAVPGALI